MKHFVRSLTLPCVALMLAVAPSVHAAVISGEVFEYTAPTNPYDLPYTTGAAPLLNGSGPTASATFTLNGSFNMTGSTGAGTYSLLNFLQSGGDTVSNLSGTAQPGDSLNNTIFEFTGTTTLTPGVYGLTHDDGMYLDLNGTTVISSGPATSADLSTFTVGSDPGDVAPGTYNYYVEYGEFNGSPGELSGNFAAPTPEPSSIALLGTGLLGAAGMFRRRFNR